MVRSDDRPDDPEVAELWDLGYVRRMDWDTELARCSMLLKRVPAPLPPSARPTALRAAMRETLKRAYVAFVSNSDQLVPASETLAAAAVMGLITEDSETYKKRSPREKRLERAAKRDDRLTIACDWFYEDLQTNAFRRTHEVKCLTTFRNALVDVLKDKDVLASIAAQFEHESLFESETSGPPRAPSVQTLGQSLHGTYIRRPRLEAHITDHLEQPGSCIVYLHGDAGTGKTRLAEECAGRYAADEAVPVINASDEDQIRENLKTLLVAGGHSATELNAYNVETYATNLFLSDGWPQIVIFDNVTDTTTLSFLPIQLKTKFLLTGIDKPPPGYSHSQVRVTLMDDDEAAAMVMDRWPDCPESDAPLLLAVLDNRPLAIEHGCAYLRESDDSVERFVSSLIERTATMAHKI